MKRIAAFFFLSCIQMSSIVAVEKTDSLVSVLKSFKLSLEKVNALIEVKQKEIIDSITYAI